jgi:hypothetical protein
VISATVVTGRVYITLLATVSKIFNTIILDRIMEPLENKIQMEQAGFCPNQSCNNQTNTLRVITEKSLRVPIPTVLIICRLFQGFQFCAKGVYLQSTRRKRLPKEIY